MKALYTLLILLIPYITFGQQTYIPDDNFEQSLIDLGYDDIMDNFFTTSNVVDVTTIFLNGNEIEDLTGIEAFINLSFLNCSNNQLTNLDLSQNSSLISLYCDNNQLAELDLSQNSSLNYLNCGNNQLTELDLSQNSSLNYLNCGNNQLTELDLSQNSLGYLNCDNNQLTELDLSQNSSLFALNCGNNQLTELNIQNITMFNPDYWYDTDNTTYFAVHNNNSLCIQVDDVNFSNNEWIQFGTNELWSNQLSEGQYFSEDCQNLNVDESLNISVIQNNLCNSNGIIQVIGNHPYSINVDFPNFTSATFSSINDTITLSGLFGGNYNISLNGSDFSEAIDLPQIVLNTNFYSPSFLTGGYNVSCYGACDAELFVNIINNSSETYTVDWYYDEVSGSPFYSSTDVSSSQANLCAGEYAILFTSSTGCESVREFTIREPDSLWSTGYVGLNDFCEGFIEIDVFGGVGNVINSTTGYVIDTLDYTFSWTGPNGFTSTDEDITSLEAGDYNLLITDNNGCENNEAYTVLEPLDSSNCITDNQDDCNVIIIPNILDPVCPGDNFEVNFILNGGTAPYLCNMSGDMDGDGIDDPVLTNISVNSSLASDLSLPTDENFELVVTDNFGCTQSYNFETEGIEPISLTPTINNPTCFGMSNGSIFIDPFTDISGGSAPYTASYGGSISFNIVNLPSDEYVITIADALGCNQLFNVFIDEPQPISANAEYSTWLPCDAGSNSTDFNVGYIYTYPTGGVAPYTFEWLGPINSWNLNDDPSNINYIGPGVYSVYIFDSLGCEVTETFEIPYAEVIEYNGYSSTSTTHCGEEACNGSITVYSYNASNESLFLFDIQGNEINANPVYTDSTITMNGLCEGEYYYGMSNNQSGCQLNSLNYTDIFITNESNCTECDFTFGQMTSVNPYCYGSSSGQIYSTSPLQFGTPPYEVTLMNGNYIQSTYITDNPQFYFGQLTSGFGYQVIITDSLGCTINEYFNLTEPQPVEFTVNNFNSYSESCFPGQDGQISFNVSGGSSAYDVYFDQQILQSVGNNNYIISNLSSGAYPISIMDMNDCWLYDTIVVDQMDLSVNLTTYDIYCSNALTDNDDLVVVDEGLVEVSLNPNQNLENVIIEITNLATQETFGTELDSFEVYSQNLVAGNYQLLAFLPNTNCFYSEEFNIVDYSLDVVISTAPSSSVFASDGSLSLNFLTSWFPYYVEISGPNNYFYETLTQNSQLDIFELSSGDYSIVITDNENCVEEFDIFLNFVPMLIGCTDSTAINFNPNAEADDGSCDYCSLSLVSIDNSNCQGENGYIEVSTNTLYEFELQILVDNEWVYYTNSGCFEYLNNGYGASWSCLPADTFMVIGYSVNDCIDTLNSSTVNLTELIESEQLPMTQIAQLSDDIYSDVISLGFDFVFNGVEYNECLISSNNYLSFNTANANIYSPWNISNAIPSNLNPLNTIMTPYQDLNPSLGGSIYYTTYGTAPNRVFIVRWKEIPMYSCSDELFSSTLYLYEGSNTIESHIEYKPICAQWNEGAAIHGIHNSDGTQADVVFDIFTNQFRNYPLLWTAINDAFLFSPLDNGIGYEISTINYGSQFNTDEYLTTTITEEFGCTDPLALNYNQAAICDDNSCEYPIVFGCTDELAFNFNEEAEINDGSCCYQNPTTIVVNTGDDLSQTSWSLSDLAENEVYSIGLSNYPENTDSARSDFLCLADGCYQINMNNWNGGSIEVYSFDEEILNVEPAIGSDITIIQFCLPIELIGCMDSLACNFNPYANEDDGSCAYPQEVNEEFTFCDGFELDGVFYNQSFMSTDTLISTGGCDSIVNSMYIINYSPDIDMFVDFFNDSLTAQIQGDVDAYQFNWNTNESTQTIAIDTNGTYSVTVTDSSSLCSSTSSINVSWLDVTSIYDDIENLNDFKIYPNPSFDVFNIELSTLNIQDIEIRVINNVGQVIYLEKVEVEGIYTKQIDLSNYSKGIYNLSINTNTETSNHRLILQ